MLLKKFKKTEENCFDPPIHYPTKLKLLLYSVFVFASISQSALLAQESKRFVISAGVSLIDLNMDSSLSGKVSDYIGPSDWSASFGGSFAKEINDKLEVGIQGSWRNLAQVNTEIAEYEVALWTLSAIVKYKFRKSSEASFQPYFNGDFGLTRFNGEYSPTLGLGAGLYYWISDRVGFQANSLWKYTFAPGNSEATDIYGGDGYFQHFIGLSYRFGSSKKTSQGGCLF